MVFRSVKEIEEELGPFISYSKNIQALRESVVSYAKENKIKLISIVSPQKGDGKSTIAIGLAAAIAHSGKNVLLVDANLRNSKLNKAFQIKNDIGFTDVVSGTIKIEKAITRSNYKNLYILPAGKTTRLSELSSDKIRGACTKLKGSEFDFVIFINAPLDNNQESIALAAISQGVLFVVAYNKTGKEVAIKAKEALIKAKANIIAFVLNFQKS